MSLIEGIGVCPAKEVCPNKGCKSEIIAVSVGAIGVKLAVECDQCDNGIRVSEKIIDMDAVDLAMSFTMGDGVASWIVAIDAPVCNGNGQDKISNGHILYNGEPTGPQ